MDWGEKITVKLENPSSMGFFADVEGKFEDYDPEAGEWIRDYENLIPRIDWETKYLINGNYSFTKKKYLVQYKLVWRGEGHAPSAFDANGISEYWIDADFQHVVRFDSFRGEPSDMLRHARIKRHLRSRLHDVYDVAEVRTSILEVMEEINTCDPTVVVFTDTTLDISNGAGNNAVRTELTSWGTEEEPRDYIVRHKCEFTLMWNQGDFGNELPTWLRTSYLHLDVPAGGTGVSVYEYRTDLFLRHEGYSVVPSVEGNAKRRLVATRHAKCNDNCEIHDGYSSEQTITNSNCSRPPYLFSPYTQVQTMHPDPYNCEIHGKATSTGCAANRIDGISVKQEYNYPREEN